MNWIWLVVYLAIGFLVIGAQHVTTLEVFNTLTERSNTKMNIEYSFSTVLLWPLTGVIGLCKLLIRAQS